MKNVFNIYYVTVLFSMVLFLQFFWVSAQGQTMVVNSKIIDSKGNPINNALITDSKGKILSYSDATGNFQIQIPDTAFIYIHAKGFFSQQLNARLITENIVLAVDEEGNKINVAYRKVEAKNINGSLSVINPEEFSEYDYSRDVIRGMNGKINGLQWYNNIWGLQNAQVFIDGVPRQFEDITMDEIKQITVLKGAHASALYGCLGAKGVILITTKRGEAFNRKVNVKINSSYGLPKMYPKFLNSADYMTLYNEGRLNDGLPILYPDSVVNNFRNGSNRYKYPDIDYYSSEYLKNYINNYDANVEFVGGNQSAKFYTNIGYDYGTTLLNYGEGKNENNQRFNARGNVDLFLNDFISGSIDVSTIFYDNKRAHGNYWYRAASILPFKYTPLIPLHSVNSDSALEIAKTSRNIIDGKYLLGGSQEYLNHPFADLLVGGYTKNIRRVLQVTNSIKVDLNKVLNGLTFTSRIHTDYSNSYNQSINNNYAVYSPVWLNDSIINLVKYGNDYRPGIENINNTWQSRNVGASLQFNYQKIINSIHEINAMLMASTINVQSTEVYQPSKYTNMGLQVNYLYKNKYGIDLIGVIVNSTKLPVKKRLGLSPSVSLSWLVSEEEFMKSISFVNWFKVLCNISSIKTDLDINNYFLYENYYASQGYYAWNDNLNNTNNSSTISLRGANPNLTYPKRNEIALGVEGIFFNHSLDFNSNIFLIRTNGLLTQRFSLYPGFINHYVPYENFNSNQYAGFDIAIAYTKRVNEDLKITIGSVNTYVVSKVIKRDELYAYDYQNRTGKPVDAIFGLKSQGFFKDENDIANSPLQMFGEVKPGDIKYIDQNNDSIIDQNDEVMIGQWIAPYSFGVNFSVNYKNFTLYVLGNGSFGGNGMKNNDYYWVDGDDKYSEVVLDRWTEATQNTAKYPRISSLQNVNNFRNSDFWLYKTNRFDIAKIQLTYNLPKRILGKGYLKALSMNVSGLDLLTLSPNKDVLNLNVYAPQFRYYTIGVKANF